MVNLPETGAENNPKNLSGQTNMEQLRVLSAAAQAVTEDLDLTRVLRRIAEIAAELLHVRYAALGVPDGQGGLKQFHTSGMTPHEMNRMDHLPLGRGLLGVLLTDTKVIRLDDMTTDSRSAGFCAHHPTMKTFLGAPVMFKGQHLGNLYLCDRVDGQAFTEMDEQLVQLLAAHAAIAIYNAQLADQLRRLAVLEERERISRDLHDGIIQEIYAIGMRLELLRALTKDGSMDTHIVAAMGSLNGVIDDLRSYIRDLDDGVKRSLSLERSLVEIIDGFRAVSPAQMDITIQPIGHAPEREQRHTIVQIAREALSNIARHANASHVKLTLSESSGMYQLTIEDNGRGFDPASANLGNGLKNMQQRAKQIGGRLDIHSVPGRGTKLSLTVPFPN
jgi:signal transduction histidine kinase